MHGVAEMCMYLPVFQFAVLCMRDTTHKLLQTQKTCTHTHMACRLRGRTFGIIKRLRYLAWKSLRDPVASDLSPRAWNKDGGKCAKQIYRAFAL